jgi:hypothetical protein
MSYFSNMAPDAGTRPQTTFITAKWTIKQLELYFFANEVDDDIRKIQSAMSDIDSEIKTWFIPAVPIIVLQYLLFEKKSAPQ